MTKLVVSDLDGTLLRSDRTISERTLAAIEGLREIGIGFAIATARPPRSVFQLLPYDFGNAYTICYNGAEIYKGKELIYEKYMDVETTAYIVNWLLAKHPQAKIALEISNHLYTNFNIDVMKGWIPPYNLVNFRSFDFKPAAKILVDVIEFQDTRELLSILPDSCSMVITDGGSLGQIAHADVAKANGIKALCGILGFKMEEVMAFGDDFNDLDMLVQCGNGIAMANAPDEVKKAADIVTLSNDDDGVAAVLEKLPGKA